MKAITELEASFKAIKEASKKIKDAIPDHSRPQAKGFLILPYLDVFSKNLAFTICKYEGIWSIEMLCMAKVELINGRWIIAETGNYEHCIEEIIGVLIGIFGGERG